MAKRTKKQKISGIFISAIVLGLVFGAYLYYRKPVVISVSPGFGEIGETVTISGRFFSREGNSVKIGQGYVHNIPSADGETIRFELPPTLSACRGEECADTLELAFGQNEISVINKRGGESADKLQFDIWRTYVNEQFKFSFGYPDQYAALGSGAYDSRTGRKIIEPWVQVSLTTSTGAMTLGVNTEKIFSWGDGCKILADTTEDVLLRNMQVVKRTRYGGEPCYERHVEYIFTQAGNSYVFSGQLNGMLDGVDFEKAAREILPTFRFY